MTREIEVVSRHLEHINAVVATQQKYAALCNVTEDVSLAELMHDVEELLGGRLEHHGVELVRDYADLPSIRTDKQKLMQVLLNVVKNATDSLKEAHGNGKGRLEIRTSRDATDQIAIRVTDNGLGISPGNLAKIFGHGFTTKMDGHGFGLHSCANIITELGGKITAESDGLGCGATFLD